MWRLTNDTLNELIAEWPGSWSVQTHSDPITASTTLMLLRHDDDGTTRAARAKVSDEQVARMSAQEFPYFVVNLLEDLWRQLTTDDEIIRQTQAIPEPVKGRDRTPGAPRTAEIGSRRVREPRNGTRRRRRSSGALNEAPPTVIEDAEPRMLTSAEFEQMRDGVQHALAQMQGLADHMLDQLAPVFNQTAMQLGEMFKPVSTSSTMLTREMLEQLAERYR